MKNPEVIIIPDVHGRSFWKEAIDKFPKEQFPNLKIIFLGDYLDPYISVDNISNEDAFYNFNLILEQAKQDSRIQLLIGNHDWHYFVKLDTCRMDFMREKEIEALFRQNIDMFKLVEIIELDDCKYVFSHAGITVDWIRDIVGLAIDHLKNWKTTSECPVKEEDPRWIWLNKVANLNETRDYEIFNKCLTNFHDNFYSCLPSMISRDRGGINPHGSLIWADVYEHLYSGDIMGIFQIFGHTISYPGGKQFEYAISPLGQSWAMLDASRAFVMDVEGNIEPIDTFET